MIERETDHRGHGVEPREDEQERESDHVLVGQAPFLRHLEQLRHEVVPVAVPALGDRTLDVLEESECGIHGSGVGIAPGRIDRLQQAVLPRQQLLPVRQRQPEQGEEHLRRVRHREVRDGVESAPTDEAVDDCPHLLAQRRFERRQAAGREERIEQPAVAHVVGRIDRDRYERQGATQRVEGALRREHLRMPTGLLHRGP